jgi:hypothetical protein
VAGERGSGQIEAWVRESGNGRHKSMARVVENHGERRDRGTDGGDVQLRGQWRRMEENRGMQVLQLRPFGGDRVRVGENGPN